MFTGDGLYRYLYKPDEQHGDQKGRGTDFTWSKNRYRVGQIVEQTCNRLLYYSQSGLDRAILHEDLMLIPEDTQIASRSVSESNHAIFQKVITVEN